MNLKHQKSNEGHCEIFFCDDKPAVYSAWLICLFVDWNSALMIIINGENDDHLEMLEGGVMRQLLDEKWKAFARVRIDN